MDGETVFLVDDDAGILKALTRLLSLSGFEVQAYQSAREFLQHYSADMPGCVILDLKLDDCSGLDLQRAMSADSYARPTIFISGVGDVPASVEAMKHGAIDFLTKPIGEDELLAAVRAGLGADRTLREEREKREEAAARFARLTPRERQVLELVVAGKLNKQIAGVLGIGEKTVKVHRARVMAKMNVRSVPDLVRGAAIAAKMAPSFMAQRGLVTH